MIRPRCTRTTGSARLSVRSREPAYTNVRTLLLDFITDICSVLVKLLFSCNKLYIFHSKTRHCHSARVGVLVCVCVYICVPGQSRCICVCVCTSVCRAVWLVGCWLAKPPIENRKCQYQRPTTSETSNNNWNNWNNNNGELQLRAVCVQCKP